MKVGATQDIAATSTADGLGIGAVSLDSLSTAPTPAARPWPTSARASVNAGSLALAPPPTTAARAADSHLLGIGIFSDATSLTVPTVDDLVSAYVSTPAGTAATAPTTLTLAGDLTVRADWAGPVLHRDRLRRVRRQGRPEFHGDLRPDHPRLPRHGDHRSTTGNVLVAANGVGTVDISASG